MAKNLPMKGTTAKIFFELARAVNPQFRAMTQDLTYEQLQAGYAGNTEGYANIVNQWFGVVVAMRLQKITVADFKDVVSDLGIVEEYENMHAAVSERLYIYPIESLEPAWLGEDGNGLKDGDTVDPWIVMKGAMTAYFVKTNFNYQGGITIQPWQAKQILASEYGMDEISAGYIRQLYVNYGKERQLAILDCLNAAINSETFPLQATQKIALASWTDTNGISSVTEDELKEFLFTIASVAMDMDSSISTGAYNAEGYDTAVNKDDMVIIMRPDIMARIRMFVRAGTFNPEDLNLPFKVRYYKDFGGMIPTNSDGNILYPVRTGKLKRLAGWATTEGATTPTVTDKTQITWVDPNAEVLAVIIQRGLIFTTDQNGIRVRSTGVNPRGEYENTFFNVINAGIHFDPHYNMVLVVKPGDGTSTPTYTAARAANAKQIKASTKKVSA